MLEKEYFLRCQVYLLWIQRYNIQNIIVRKSTPGTRSRVMGLMSVYLYLQLRFTEQPVELQGLMKTKPNKANKSLCTPARHSTLLRCLLPSASP